MRRFTLFFIVATFCGTLQAQELRAGVARVDITDHAAGPVNDPCFAKALVLENGQTKAVLVTVDAVAIGEIGRIGNGFLATVRAAAEEDLGIPASGVIINASHCHGVVRADTVRLVIDVVRKAAGNLRPVKVAAGNGSEGRISENRRMLLKDGTQVDMRRAYAMPVDETVATIGPIDPQVGLLRLDLADGQPLAVVYHFACHPIMNPPSKGNSADYPGFASKTIEGALGGEAMAFFVQGCGGDINPIRYKETSRPADAEPLGTMLGATVLAAARKLEPRADATLKVSREVMDLPRAADFQNRIKAIEAEQTRLLVALKATNINFKAFLPLMLQHKLWPEHPSHHVQSYLRDGKPIEQLDADNRALVDSYLANIAVMEQLTRLNTNLALLKRHLAQTEAAGGKPLEVEVCGLRVGDFKLVTFPGEITVQVGLNIKKAVNDPHAHVSGYTNGYIYYTPTADQRLNKGYAQEDCDTLVAPAWQRLFEAMAAQVVGEMARP
jgi:hypothetical protein